MPAQTEGRDPGRVGSEAIPVRASQALPVAASTVIYGGSLIFVNSSGYATATSPDQTMTCVGYAESDVDNSTGSAGALTIIPRIGVIKLANSGSGDAISADDVGKLAYAADNQTAALTSASSTRAAIGPIIGMDGTQVVVLAGYPANRALQNLEAVQPIDADLTAIAALSSTGLLARTGSGTYSERTLTAPAAGITVTNGNGVSGNPTLALANDLAALEGLAATGLVARTADGAMSARTLTAASARCTITNGDGVSGNPTIEVPGGIIEVSDPGTGQAIPVTGAAYIGLTIAGSETNTLAVPTAIGTVLQLNCDTYTSGSRVITSAQAINQAGNTVLTFGAARDYIVLRSIKVGGALRWQVSYNDGVALS